MEHRIQGNFEVTTTLQSHAAGEGEGISRLLLDKRFDGQLEAHSQGQMLAFRSAVAGSAGYVAMEVVEGTLLQKRGRFVLQHTSVMHRGVSQLQLSVVPDSGTEGLTGLFGTMQIEVENGQHRYVFDFSFAEVSGH